MLEGILGALEGSEDLNEHCRKMLIVMATPSLSKPKGARHDMQNVGVTMIEETLQGHKSKLVEAVEVAQNALSDLEGSKNTLLQRVDETKASLAEKEAAKTAARTAHDQAMAAAQHAEGVLTAAGGMQEAVEAAQAALDKEKIAMTTAYQEHFVAPMASNEGPHHNFLKPFIAALGFEESLISALPSSCCKTKEQRGGFDDLVLSEFGKALTEKIAFLEKSVADGISGVSEHKAGVEAAKQALEGRKLTEKIAAVDLEAATTAQSEAEAEVSKASEEWTTFQPRLQAATDDFNLQDAKRQDFEQGTLKNFETLRDKETPMLVESEAAAAGA